MFNKKTKIFCVLSILFIMLLSVSMITAADTDNAETTQQPIDTPEKVVSAGSVEKTVNNIETQEKQITKKNQINNLTKKATNIEVTEENYENYFDGGIYSDNATEITFSGVLRQKQFIFSTPVAITSKDNNTKLYDSAFYFFTGADGSSLKNLYIEDKNYTDTVITLSEVNRITISDNTIIQYNDDGETHAISLDGADKNIIKNNIINVSGTEKPVEYGGMMGFFPLTDLSSIELHFSCENEIRNNTVTTKAIKSTGSPVSTTLGITTYADPYGAYFDEEDPSTDNLITQNTIHTEGINYAYSIRLSNLADDNTITENNISAKSNFAYGIEYAYGENAIIHDNTLEINGTRISYGIIYTTNSMGNINKGSIRNNNIKINDVNVAYAIEFYGAARSYDTVIDNNTINATGGRIIGIAGALSNRLNITNNRVNIIGNSTRTDSDATDEIPKQLSGVVISKSSSGNFVTGNKINLTDLADDQITSLNLTITNGVVTGNELYTSSANGPRSIIVTGTGNTVGNNTPLEPEPVTLTLIPVASESGLQTEIVLEAKDKRSKTFTHGNVVFKLNEEIIGESTVTDGIANITFTPELAVGTYTITATYQADDWFMENTTTADLIIREPYTGVYYVSPDGSDINEGSINAPKKTVKNAVDMANKEGKNKNIVIMEGTYDASNIEITAALNITGEGNVILDANKKGPVFQVKAGQTEIKNMALINGLNKNGGAIEATADLIIENVTFENNNATSYGGALYSEKTLSVYDSVFINNNGSTGGGAIYSIKENTTVDNSTFENNYATSGGAVYIRYVTIIQSSFINNWGRTIGGAIYVSGYGTISDSNIDVAYSNSYGGAVYYSDTSYANSLNITNLNISNVNTNHSVIYHTGGSSYLENVKIMDSISKQNLIYLNRGNLTITNSVIENNTAKSLIYSYDRTTAGRYSVLTIENSTITNNVAENIFEARGQLDLVSNTITYNNATTDQFFKVFNSSTLQGVINSENNTYIGNNLPSINVTVYEENILNKPTNITVKVIRSPYFEKVQAGKLLFDDGKTVTEYQLEDNEAVIEYTPTKTLTHLLFKYIIDDGDYVYAQETVNLTASEQVDVDVPVIEAPTDMVLGETSNLSVPITFNGVAVDEGYVIFKVNGKTLRDNAGNVIYVPVENGSADMEFNITAEFLKEGTVVQAIYLGSDNYLPQPTEAIPVTVTKKTADLSLNNVTIARGGSAQITVSVTYNNEPVNAGRVVLKINGKSIKDEQGKVLYVNVVNGVATIPYTVTEKTKAKDYELTAVFTDSNYERAEATATLTVTG